MPAQKTSSMQDPTPQPTNLPFSLQDGETITESVKPQRNGFFLKNGFAYLFLGIFVAFVDLIIAIVIGTALGSILWGILSFIILIALYVAIIYLAINAAYGKYQYWITTHRVIGSRGVIGYSTDSIPLEMIADVIVNRGIIDRILGLSTLFIMPIGGMGMMYGAGMSGTNYLTALTQADAVRIQKDILDARNRRKKDMSK